MAYPNTSVLNIIIPQTSASIDPTSTQAPFVERIISGSRLILQTTIDGTLTGSSDLNVNSITASNISASGYISASNLYVKTNITDAGTLTVVGTTTLAGLTGTTATFSGLVSASANITSSNEYIAGTLTVVGATTLAGLTGTTATFSGLVSASAGLTASAIQDDGTLTVVGNSILSTVFATNVTASNISASGNITSSNEYIAGTLTVIGNSTLSTVFATNITASNISASGNISASTLRVETSIVDGGTLTVLGNTVLGDTVSDTTQITGSTSLSGSLSVVGTTTLQSTFATNITASNISASGNISSSTLYVVNDATINGDLTINGGDIILTSSATVIYLKPNDIEPLNIVCISGSNSGSYMGFNTNGSEAEIKFVVPKITLANPNDAIGYLDAGHISNSASLQLVGGATFGKSVWISGSLNVRNNFIVSGSTVLGDAITDTTRITGSASISGSLSVVGNTTLQSTFVTNLTASNISASGFISGSSLNITNDGTINGDLTVNGGDIVLSNTATNISLLDNVGNALDIKEAANSYIKVDTTNSTENVKFGTTPTVYVLKTTDNDLLTYGNGALQVDGGVGINKNLFVGANTYTVGNSSITGSLTVGTTLRVNGNSILGDALTDVNTSSGSLRVLNAINNDQSTYTNGALIVDGGVGIGKNLFVSGSMLVGGDFTVFGSSSVVYISSSTVIINDNIIQLNAFFPFERYAGIEVFDSGSNQRSASLLWDGHNDNWITVDQNNSASNIIHGPTASFGTNPDSLTANNIPKAYDATGITDSLLSDDATTLRYTGNVISASSITASYGTFTYITGALVTYVTGSFTTLTIATGSSPGAGAVPQHPTASGMAGQINVDNNFVYVYTNNIWKRVPLSTWSL